MNMEKQKVIVPKGIRYISQWSEFSIPDFPCIFNKQLTGCGFTEWCITNNENVVLCSPRKILLENKEEQHDEVLYVRNEFERSLEVDKDLSITNPKGISVDEAEASTNIEEVRRRVEEMKNQIKIYTLSRVSHKVPVKILVTYDSFRYVKEVLESLGVLNSFRIVIDEWQSIFTDSTFKSSTEIEFLDFLAGIHKVCFVSATPMIDKYLEMLDEFKDLPYYELDWRQEDPGRVIKPNLSVNPCRSITKVAADIINSYRDPTKHEKSSMIDETGRIVEVESREAVIYVNSVRNICDIIRKAELKLEETNVLCARTPENEKKVKKAFGLKGKIEVLGKVPAKDETRKMFTLCTRTVYLGADFYSTNARTFVFSDANIDSLTVDITLDLPQILGRQRWDCNPWKNSATLYYKAVNKDDIISPEVFLARIKKKEEKTEGLLRSYSLSLDKDKHNLAEEYQNLAKTFNYKNHYVAVNTHGGKDLVPVYNNLVKISNLRTYEIQQVDYKDRFSVFSTLEAGSDFSDKEVDLAVSEFDTIKTFVDRLKFLCNTGLSHDQLERFVSRIPTIFQNYYRVLGIVRIKSLGYNKYYLDKEYNKLYGNQDVNMKEVSERVLSTFSVGQKYSKSDIKAMLGDIYVDLKLSKTPKASDLEEYFVLKSCLVTNRETGKRDAGFEILKRKD